MNAAAVHAVLLLTVIRGPADRAVTRSAAEALVAPFVEAPRLIVQELGAPPTSERAAALLRDSGASAVVVIACEGPDCARVALDVGRSDGQLFTRVLRFDREDALPERGRAVGLLASTLLPEDWNRGPPRAVAAAPVVPPAPSAPPPRVAHWTAQADGAFFIPTAGVHEDVSLILSARRRLRWGLEAGVLLRVERGDMESDRERGDFVGGGGGLSAAWMSAGWQAPGRFGYGARFDLLAVRRQIRHQETEQVETHDYWAFGGDAGLMAGVRISSAFGLVATAGVESLTVAFADEEDGRAARTLSQYRWMTELGVLARF